MREGSGRATRLYSRRASVFPLVSMMLILGRPSRLCNTPFYFFHPLGCPCLTVMIRFSPPKQGVLLCVVYASLAPLSSLLAPSHRHTPSLVVSAPLLRISLSCLARSRATCTAGKTNDSPYIHRVHASRRPREPHDLGLGVSPVDLLQGTT